MTAIVLLIISTIIGAGFATGAELLTFFGHTGLPAILIAFFVGIFLFTIMMVLVIFGRKKQNKIIKHIFTAVYCAVFVVMTAGMVQLCGLTITFFALIFCITIIIFGFKSILIINKYLMFFVLSALLFAYLTNFDRTTGQPENIEPQVFRSLVSALLYASMNCCLLEPVISKCLETNSKSKLAVSCAVAAVIISLFIALILTSIQTQNITASMPIIALSPNLITYFAVFLSVLTSMLICLFNIRKNTNFRTGGLTITCILAFFLSLFGFTETMGFFYSIIGTCFLVYLVWLLFHSRRNLMPSNSPTKQ